jgi:hypothetical protein
MAAKNSIATGGLGGSVLRILKGVLIGAVLICGAFYGAVYFLSHAPSSVHLSDAQLYPLAYAERKAALAAQAKAATDEASPLELQSYERR